ncbi:endocuticle structural glycoprotein SgAbd-2-like [Athalia rosae]|uniref:endocuticle structural glycoprotein SgAbd-2-like n=1 Tax=Athalia rosae TaxID=37344 RepID=UPI00203343E6|nr:endocuticle structural glycoprotein SgAbd-2-like [Athalia rosae]
MNAIVLVGFVILAAVSAAVTDARNDVIAIVSQEQEVNPDGSFSSKWESANGISYEEKGVRKNVGQKDEAEDVQGSAKWTAPDGTKLELSWHADENGAVFEGDHLPTPPPTQPIPEAIQRSLDWNAAHPYKEESEPKGKL